MSKKLPDGFKYLSDIDATIQQDIKYASDDNFIGQIIPGYEAPCSIITIQAGLALSEMQKELLQQGLALLIYDTYRPLRAVEFFCEWGQNVVNQKNKSDYYPRIDKKDFFKLRYLGFRSSHCRGSTVDLTLINTIDNHPLDMGTRFDFMDPLSHPACKLVTDQQYQNRQLLQNIMAKYGFVGIETEWWHFTLKDEPFPDCYFDFPIIGK